jgi:hypothetical protein
MTHSTRSNGVTPGAGIDPGHHALLVGQSHRNRAEIDRPDPALRRAGRATRVV